MSKLKYPKFAIFQVRRLKKCDFSLSGELLQSRSEFEKPDAAAAVVDRVDRDDLSVRTPARMQVAADIVRRTFRLPVAEGSERFEAAALRIDQDQRLKAVLRIAVGEDIPPVRRTDHVGGPAVSARQPLRMERAAAFVEYDCAAAVAGPVRIDQDLMRRPSPDLVRNPALPESELVYRKVIHPLRMSCGSSHWRKSQSTRLESQLKIA